MIEYIRKENLLKNLHMIAKNIDQENSVVIAGVVTKTSGLKIETNNLSVPVGTICQIMIDHNHKVNAEVIGFSKDATYLMAIETIDGLTPGCLVVPMSRISHARVGIGLLGRIIDGAGHPIDGKGAIQTNNVYPLNSKPINPLARKRISQPLNVGIRAINGLLTVSKGQRLGIFAGSGVGKSVLLGMMTKYTNADVVVVGLIGERGREVKEFIEENLGDQGIKKSVVVAAAADTTPLMRANGAILATSIAEYFRDQGKDVLLIVDSLTRYAHAQREIALSAGELPATKGFTPSVFAKLSQLVERSGNGSHIQGSITAFYTVLMDGDETNDPIAEHVRSVLDGHIVLSKHLADSGHYPAIDIEKSISRVMSTVVEDNHLKNSLKFKRLYSAYQQNKDLVNIGMYQHGADLILDDALKYKEKIHKYLVQSMQESFDYESSVKQLSQLFL